MNNNPNSVSKILKQNKFLSEYKNCLSITKASKISKIHYQNFYHWIKEEEFKSKFDKINKEAIDNSL